MNYINIQYPDPNAFKKNPVIGVTAPSSGLGNDVFHKRFEIVSKQLTSRGYKIIEGSCLRENYKHVSDNRKNRVKDFLDLWVDSDVGAIIPPWGGEVLIDILELIDFESLLKSNPKWILGYSDISTLLFSVTIMTGIATAHGINFMDLIDGQDDDLSRKSLDILKTVKGESIKQTSSRKYQTKFVNFNDDINGKYNLTEPTEWKSLDAVDKVNFQGRLVGGCIDTLCSLVGTPYGDLDYFKKTFARDGVILYFENCALTPCQLLRVFYQMKYANWFDDINGIILGRSTAKEVSDPNSLSYLDVLETLFKDCEFPLIYDADIGHRPPNMTIINGAFAEVLYEKGAATVLQHLI